MADRHGGVVARHLFGIQVAVRSQGEERRMRSNLILIRGRYEVVSNHLTYLDQPACNAVKVPARFRYRILTALAIYLSTHLCVSLWALHLGWVFARRRTALLYLPSRRRDQQLARLTNYETAKRCHELTLRRLRQTVVTAVLQVASVTSYRKISQ